MSDVEIGSCALSSFGGERQTPQKIITGLSSKADQIHALAHAGYLRTEIAKHLDIRYQHVRQVLERSGISLGKKQAIPVSAKTNTSRPKPRSTPVITEDPITVSRLIENGFVRIGQWQLASDDAFIMDCVVPTDPGVYVFVVDGTIRYIGLTQRGLRNRMAHYVRGHIRQRTSARVKGLILSALGSGSSIEVLIASPQAMTWNGLPVLTSPGLEAGLIRAIRPEWNMQGLGM